MPVLKFLIKKDILMDKQDFGTTFSKMKRVT